VIKDIGINMEQDTSRRLQVLKAEKKVKKIKRFYVHIFIYFVVNLVWFIVLLILGELSSYTKFGFWGMGYGQISMALFWAIGLLVHGQFVFAKNISISKKWEDKKIKALLEKESQRWE